MPSGPLFLAGLLAAAPARAAEPAVSEKLERLAVALTEQHDAKRPANKGDSLAVLDFNAPEKLARERAGFAVSELLLQKLVRNRSFTVVERSAIQRVLDEQKLQGTGAIDPQTAVRIGRLVGAHLLLLGSIDKLGGVYQTNARIVLVESGEVVAAGYEEFPRKAFEDEAKPYLALVPDTQAIGVYLAGGLGTPKFSERTARTFSGTMGSTAYSMTLTPTAGGADFPAIGLGVRYLARPWLMLDAAYFPVALQADGEGQDSASGTTNSSDGPFDMHGLEASGNAVRLSANWVRRLGPRSFGYLGLGAVGLQPTAYDEQQNNRIHEWGGSSGVKGNITFQETKGGGWGAFLRAGAEWRPQERFGIALFGQFLPDPPALKQQVGSEVYDGTETRRYKTDFFDAELPQASLELTAALYF